MVWCSQFKLWLLQNSHSFIRYSKIANWEYKYHYTLIVWYISFGFKFSSLFPSNFAQTHPNYFLQIFAQTLSSLPICFWIFISTREFIISNSIFSSFRQNRSSAILSVSAIPSRSSANCSDFSVPSPSLCWFSVVGAFIHEFRRRIS